MLSFHFPQVLWALVLLPLLLLLLAGYRRWQKARVQSLGDAPLQPGLWRGKSPVISPTIFLPLLAVACLALAAAGPYEPKGGIPPPSKGVDVMLVLDASRSMRARDVQPGRLDRAFSFFIRLSDQLEGDRIGLIVFAGRPYLQVPLTTDRGALRMALQSVMPESLPTQGTLISPALAMAARSFPENTRRARVAVLVSDGEDHDEAGSDVTQLLRQQGVHLITLGVGTPEGAPLFEADGSPKSGPNGERVITKLEEGGLQSLAGETGGTYTRLQDATADAARVGADIQKLPATSLSAAKGEEPAAREYFPLLAGIALVLLLLQKLVESVGRKARVSTKISMAALLLFGAFGVQAQTDWQEGARLYREGKYPQAAEAFKRALADSSVRAATQYNLGNALYKKGDFAGARTAFEESTRGKKNSDATYNLGNSYAERKQWQQALKAYQQALQEKPGAADAQQNYAYARKQFQRQQMQEQQQKQQQSHPKKENEKPQLNPSNLSKEQAEKMLQALRQEEQKLADRKKESSDAPEPPGKDW